MDPTEEALSDVHVGRPNQAHPEAVQWKGYSIVITRFCFKYSVETEEAKNQQEEATESDDDGDLLVQRPNKCQKYDDVITIEHAMSTRIDDVGLQVWSGSLLLCDYILHHANEFKGQTVVELGGGVGLASIVAATVAKTVICTDIGQQVLETCARNAEYNKHLYGYLKPGNPQNIISVKQLDWLSEEPLLNEMIVRDFQWSFEDTEALNSALYLLAADIVYNDYLTDAFFRTIHSIMSHPPNRTLIISVERRLNFTLADLEVSCPAYEHFLHCIQDLNLLEVEGKFCYKAQQLDISFPQYMDYNRTKYIELWEIKSFFS